MPIQSRQVNFLNNKKNSNFFENARFLQNLFKNFKISSSFSKISYFLQTNSLQVGIFSFLWKGLWFCKKWVREIGVQQIFRFAKNGTTLSGSRRIFMLFSYSHIPIQQYSYICIFIYSHIPLTSIFQRAFYFYCQRN